MKKIDGESKSPGKTVTTPDKASAGLSDEEMKKVTGGAGTSCFGNKYPGSAGGFEKQNEVVIDPKGFLAD